MGAMKNYAMVLEDKVWETFAQVLPECDDIVEAVERGINIAKDLDLDRYLGVNYISDGVHEMWNEYWSNYAT